MLTIRLQRTGKKNQADFRIVLAEKEAPVTKKVVEVLGSYNPRSKNFQVKEERLKYWIAQKVQLSETLNNLLVSKNLVEGAKVKAFTIPKKPVAEKPAEAASAPAENQAVPSAEASEAKPAETAPDVSAEALAKAEVKAEETTAQ